MRLSGITMKQIRFWNGESKTSTIKISEKKKIGDFGIIFVAGLQNWIESKVSTSNGTHYWVKMLFKTDFHAENLICFNGNMVVFVYEILLCI